MVKYRGEWDRLSRRPKRRVAVREKHGMVPCLRKDRECSRFAQFYAQTNCLFKLPMCINVDAILTVKAMQKLLATDLLIGVHFCESLTATC